MTFVESLKRHRLELAGVLLLLAATYWEIVAAMARVWAQDDNYSHGFLVPLIAAWFVWRRRDDIASTEARSWWPGLVVVLAGLGMLAAGFLVTEYFTMRMSLVVVLAGALLLLFGRESFRPLRLPVGYLAFMVPIPYILYDAAALPMKRFVAKVSVAVLKGMGYVVLREGNIIQFPNVTLEVADACSGLRSIMSLLALSVAYAFLTQRTTWKRWVMVLSAFPAAIICNMLRVIGTGILARHFGPTVAQGFFHEFAGMAVFALAMVMLIGLDWLLRRGGERS